MSFDPDLKIPWGYGTAYKRLDDVRAVLLVHYHPEYIRRLLAWLTSKGGAVGIGGTWRAGGAQPDKPGFAPEGKSFHQDQAYNDGFVGACAVDLVASNGTLVHRSPRWSEVPSQGSQTAVRWGVHCNISTEPWHMQPVEIDGWLMWWNAGRPAPVIGYPIPGETPPPTPTPTPTPPEDDQMVDADDIRNVWTAPPPELVKSGAKPENLIWFNAMLAKIGTVTDVQRRNGLKVDGSYGPLTRAAYDKELAAMKATVGA